MEEHDRMEHNRMEHNRMEHSRMEHSRMEHSRMDTDSNSSNNTGDAVEDKSDTYMPRLISLVSQYKALWDQDSLEYKDNSLKDSSWERIAAIMGSDTETVIKKWKNARDAHCRRQKALKLGQAKWTPYKYSSMLTFLNQYQRHHKKRHTLRKRNTDDEVLQITPQADHREGLHADDVTVGLHTGDVTIDLQNSDVTDDATLLDVDFSLINEAKVKLEPASDEESPGGRIHADGKGGGRTRNPSAFKPAYPNLEQDAITVSVLDDGNIEDEVVATAEYNTRRDRGIPPQQNEKSTKKTTRSRSKGTVNESNKINEDEHWLLSLVPTFKRLSNFKRAMAKVRIQQCLIDVEFNETENPNGYVTAPR